MLQLSTLFTSLFIVGFVGLHCCWAFVWLWGVGLPSSCSAWAAHCVACSLCGVFTAWHAHCVATHCMGPLTAWARSPRGPLTAWPLTVARSPHGRSLWPAHHMAAHCDPLTAWPLTAGPGAGGLGSCSYWALVDRLRNCGA